MAVPKHVNGTDRRLAMMDNTWKPPLILREPRPYVLVIYQAMLGIRMMMRPSLDGLSQYRWNPVQTFPSLHYWQSHETSLGVIKGFNRFAIWGANPAV